MVQQPPFICYLTWQVHRTISLSKDETSWVNVFLQQRIISNMSYTVYSSVSGIHYSTWPKALEFVWNSVLANELSLSLHDKNQGLQQTFFEIADWSIVCSLRHNRLLDSCSKQFKKLNCGWAYTNTEIFLHSGLYLTSVLWAGWSKQKNKNRGEQSRYYEM